MTMTGLMSMNRANMAFFSATQRTAPKTSGSSADSSCSRALSARFGSTGIWILRGRLDGSSRGGRLNARPPSPVGARCASGCSGLASASTFGPTWSSEPGSQGLAAVSGSPSSSSGTPPVGCVSGSTMVCPAEPPGPIVSRAA